MRAVLLAVTLAFVVGCGATPTTSEKSGEGKGEKGKAPAGKKLTREEARKKLAGKTQDEVKAAWGKPEKTIEYPEPAGGGAWFYPASANIVWDAAAEKYISAWVEFDVNKKCIDVR